MISALVQFCAMAHEDMVLSRYTLPFWSIGPPRHQSEAGGISAGLGRPGEIAKRKKSQIIYLDTDPVRSHRGSENGVAIRRQRFAAGIEVVQEDQAAGLRIFSAAEISR